VQGKPIQYGFYDKGGIIIGSIFTIIGLILFIFERYKISSKGRIFSIRANVFEALLVGIILITLAGVGGWIYGHHTLVTTKLVYKEMTERGGIQNNSPFYCKKVIIRNDDVGGKVDPALEWVTNLTIEKDIKMTYAVIPAVLQNNSGTIHYLNDLDREHFEMATHGYYHIHFAELPYEEQYYLIENGTKIMEEKLHVKPCTFIPPYGSSNVNTTRACMILGYHSITDMRGYPSYITDFITDFGWESSWHPVSHHNFTEFKNSFDTFYNSSDEFYVDLLHSWTFRNESGELNKTMTSIFEKSIDYVKGKNVQFMTFEEAYEWRVDENTIGTGKVNESCYFIDLEECRYNHSIKFNSHWEGNTLLTDITTGETRTIYKDIFEFDGIRGHCYEFYTRYDISASKTNLV
jgi:peptidoglycan/xylan/chitin deacetylase (PgdA/CDA1 family)